MDTSGRHDGRTGCDRRAGWTEPGRWAGPDRWPWAGSDVGHRPARRGSEVLEGTGTIVFEATDEAGVRHLYRVAASTGAAPEDLTPSLDVLGGGDLDEAISISPDGEWLAIGAGRFDDQCDGWPCTSLVRADLSERRDGAARRPGGPSRGLGRGGKRRRPGSSIRCRAARMCSTCGRRARRRDAGASRCC